QREIALAKEAEARNSAKEEKEARELVDKERLKVLFEKNQAELARRKAEWQLYVLQIANAQREWDAGNAWLAQYYLNQCRPDLRGWEHDYLYSLGNQHHETLRGRSGQGLTGVVYSPDGKLLACAANYRMDNPLARRPGEVQLWDAVSGQLVRTLTDFTGSVQGVAFSPDSKSLVSVSGPPREPGELKLWDVATGRLIWTQQGEKSRLDGRFEGDKVEIFRCVAFSPDGKYLATGSLFPQEDRTVKLWDAASGKVLR